VTEIPINPRGIKPERRPAFYLQQFRTRIIIPLDDNSILQCFPFRAGYPDTELGSFTTQPRKNCAADSMKRLLWIARHQKILCLKGLSRWMGRKIHP
jgi:hypothetical protein